MKAEFKALPDLTQGQNEDIDQWVERIGVIGAMLIHPQEFEADEIIKELEAYGVGAMTSDMAEVIREKYWDENKFTGFTKTAVVEAWEW